MKQSALALSRRAQALEAANRELQHRLNLANKTLLDSTAMLKAVREELDILRIPFFRRWRLRRLAKRRLAEQR
jgi:hypothetical protein